MDSDPKVSGLAISQPAEDHLAEEIIELGEDTLEFISGSLLMVCDTGPC